MCFFPSLYTFSLHLPTLTCRGAPFVFERWLQDVEPIVLCVRKAESRTLQIELVGFNRASCRQLFRICLSAEDSNRLVGMLVEGGDATLLSEMEQSD